MSATISEIISVIKEFQESHRQFIVETPAVLEDHQKSETYANEAKRGNINYLVRRTSDMVVYNTSLLFEKTPIIYNYLDEFSSITTEEEMAEWEEKIENALEWYKTTFEEIRTYSVKRNYMLARKAFLDSLPMEPPEDGRPHQEIVTIPIYNMAGDIHSMLDIDMHTPLSSFSRTFIEQQHINKKESVRLVFTFEGEDHPFSAKLLTEKNHQRYRMTWKELFRSAEEIPRIHLFIRDPEEVTETTKNDKIQLIRSIASKKGLTSRHLSDDEIYARYAEWNLYFTESELTRYQLMKKFVEQNETLFI